MQKRLSAADDSGAGVGLVAIAGVVSLGVLIPEFFVPETPSGVVSRAQ
jgi:hypothetical protein